MTALKGIFMTFKIVAFNYNQMSRYQYKPQIHNPEKRVSNEIIGQFLTVVKTGDIDRIREFVIKNNLKGNLRSGSSSFKDQSKGGDQPSTSAKGETAIHVVLQLDDTVANPAAKLEIIKYLASIGAPLEYPDGNNRWPIHLAVETQSPEIVRYFVKHTTQLNRRDASGNNPLHLAVNGRSTPCPEFISPKPLVEPSPVNQLQLNNTYRQAEKYIVNYLSNDPVARQKLLDISDAILGIPEMNRNEPYFRDTERDALSVFTDAATDLNYAPGSSAGYSRQIEKLNQLISKTYAIIKEQSLNKSSAPLKIEAYNKGWGPDDGARPPTDAEHILREDAETLKRNVRDKMQASLETASGPQSLEATQLTKNAIQMLRDINDKYLQPLLFCKGCPSGSKTINGETTSLQKMLAILMINDARIRYVDYQAEHIMYTVPFMEPTEAFNTITSNGDVNLSKYGGYIFYNTLSGIIRASATADQLELSSQDAIDFKNFNDTVADVIQALISNSNQLCILRELRSLFSNADDMIVNVSTAAGIAPIPYPAEAKSQRAKFYNENMKKLVLGINNSNLQKAYNEIQRLYPNVSKGSWVSIINYVIGAVKPTTTSGNDIFNAAGTMQAPVPPLPRIVGASPVIVAPGPFQVGDYTLLDLFRIMNCIHQYLETGDYNVLARPLILTQKPSQWNTIIDEISAAFGATQPLFVFCYRVLVAFAYQRIRTVLKQCYNAIFGLIINYNTTNPSGLPQNQIDVVNQLKQMLGEPLTDAHMYNALLPFPIWAFTTNENPYETYTGSEWNFNNPLVNWFSVFADTNIPLKDRMHIFENIYADIDANFGDLTSLPAFIALMNILVKLTDDKRFVLERLVQSQPTSGDSFRDSILNYFGTLRSPSSALATNPSFIPEFEDYTVLVQWQPLKPEYDDNFNDQIVSLANYTDPAISLISVVRFAADVYAYLMFHIKKLFFEMLKHMVEIEKITATITAYINGQIYYYIPQIFLPVLVVHMMHIIRLLIKAYDLTTHYQTRYAARLPNHSPTIDTATGLTIPPSIPAEFQNITNIGNNFLAETQKNLENLYASVKSLGKYHNTVINFLNIRSSHELYANIETGAVNKVFDSPLQSLPELPVLLTSYRIDDPDPTSVITSTYQTSAINYYDDDDSDLMLNQAVELDREIQMNPLTPDIYRDVSLIRTGTISSNVPDPGDNSQFNFDPQKGLNGVLVEAIAISGSWLEYDDVAKQYSFSEGFIGWRNEKYPRNATATTTMYPEAMTQFVDDFVLKNKFDVVTNIIQHVVDNRSTDPATKTFYNSLAGLATPANVDNPDFAYLKSIILTGIITDNLVSGIIDYKSMRAARQWFSEMIQRNPGISPATANKILPFISKNSKDRLLLTTNDRKTIENVLKNDPRRTDQVLSQIAPDPTNLPFSTPQKQVYGSTGYVGTRTGETNPRKLVHYLYDENYRADNRGLKNCYYIDPEVSVQLITTDTINAKNFDGDTPMHLAVRMGSQKLVEQLIDKGANPFGFSNNDGKNAYITAVESLEQHLEFSRGLTVYDTISRFAVAFNDMLLERLRSSESRNNIVKNITYAIPIQLVMYNHMWFCHLENYRYGSTAALKASLNDMLMKRFHFKDVPNYPFDLMQISADQLETVLDPMIAPNRTAETYNSLNAKKLEKLGTKLLIAKNQLEGLQLEKNRSQDSYQIKLLNDAIVQAQIQISDIETNIQDLKMEPEPAINYTSITIYPLLVRDLAGGLNQRMIPLTDFYSQVMSKVSNNPEVHLSIWNNYLHKEYKQTPSMIFSLIDSTISGIVFWFKNDNLTPEYRKQLDTVIETLTLVETYINTKASLPDFLEDNPMLAEEFSHLKYIINLVLTPAIYNIFMSQIYESLKAIDLTDTLTGKTQEVFDAISNTRYANQTIQDYIYNILPQAALAFYTTTYQNQNDPERTVVDSSDLFFPILQIVKNNPLMELTDSSPVISTLINNLIPFLADTYQNLIYHLRLAVYGYERYILNTLQKLRIVDLMIRYYEKKNPKRIR